MPTVSVIIPTYNRGDLVKDAIHSVLNQSYSDYEIIVVDDGSTDNTRDVVGELSSRSRKVIYLYQDNKGPSAARNLGIRAARGDYIAFLDSDDIFLPDKLRVQVSALEADQDFGMAYSTILALDEHGRVSKGGGPIGARLSGWVYPQLLSIQGTAIMTPSVMVRACVLDDVGGFDETMHICEDLDLWRRIAKRYKVLRIADPLVMVRYRQGDLSTSALQEYLQARTFYYRKAIAEDPTLEKSVQSKLFIEMYCHYGVEAFFKGDVRLARQLLKQSLETDTAQFVKSSGWLLFRFVSFGGAFFLRRHFSPANYHRLKQIYRSFINCWKGVAA